MSESESSEEYTGESGKSAYQRIGLKRHRIYAKGCTNMIILKGDKP